MSGKRPPQEEPSTLPEDEEAMQAEEEGRIAKPPEQCQRKSEKNMKRLIFRSEVGAGLVSEEERERWHTKGRRRPKRTRREQMVSQELVWTTIS